MPKLMRKRSLSWGFTDEEITFSLELSASECNLAGRGIASLPITEEDEGGEAVSDGKVRPARERGTRAATGRGGAPS